MSDDEPIVPGEDENEDEDVPEEAPAAPAAKPTGVGAPVRSPPKPRGKHPWSTKDADDLWPEILGALPKMRPARRASDVDARVIRLEPGPRTPITTLRGAQIEGNSYEPSRDALIRLIDQMHVQTSPNGGAAKYEVAFTWRVGSQLLARGEIERPTVAEVVAMRRGVGSPAPQPQYPRFDAPVPPPQAPQAQPQPLYPQGPPPPLSYYPSGVGAPPGPDPRDQWISQMMEFLIARGMQPPAAPPTIATPPQAPPAWASGLVAEVQALRSEVQVLRGHQAPVPSVGIGAAHRFTHEDLARRRNEFDLIREFKTLNDEMTSFFSPATAETLAGAPMEPEDETLGAPGDDLPYQLVEIQGADANSLIQRFARDKKTGNIDFQHTAINNPKLAEKLVEVAGKLTDTLGKLFKEAQGPVQQDPSMGQPPPPPVQTAPNGLPSGGGLSDPT